MNADEVKEQGHSVPESKSLQHVMCCCCQCTPVVQNTRKSDVTILAATLSMCSKDVTEAVVSKAIVRINMAQWATQKTSEVAVPVCIHVALPGRSLQGLQANWQYS